jgi:ATP-binding cassette subfamily F protein uup
MGDKQLRDLPRGVDEYLVHRIEELNQVANAPVKTKTISDAAATRNAKKDMNRIDRQLSKLNDAEKRLHEKMALAVDDFELLTELSLKQKELIRDRADLEAQWLEACEIAGE